MLLETPRDTHKPNPFIALNLIDQPITAKRRSNKARQQFQNPPSATKIGKQVMLRLETGVEEAMNALFTKSSVKVCNLSHKLAVAFHGLTIYAVSPELNKFI